jgi:hypothetical protein
MSFSIPGKFTIKTSGYVVPYVPSVIPTQSAITDQYFKYNTLLVNGNGANNGTNNTFLDSGPNNFTVTRNGTPTQGAMNPFGTNWSGYFNGSTDYFTVAHNAALNLSSGDFTLEAWIYPTTITGNTQGNILCKDGVAGSSYASYILQFNGVGTGTIWFGVGSGNGVSYAQVITSNTNVAANTWNHVAATKSGSTLRLFLNGVLVASGSQTGTIIDGGKPLYVGYQQGQAASSYFAGNISNVRVVKGAAIYTGSFTPSSIPLTSVSGTSLLTLQSNRFKDNSSNNFAITSSGTPKITPFAPFSPSSSYSPSVYGGSVYFADGSGYLTLQTSSLFQMGTGDMTAEAWVYLDRSVHPLSSSTIIGYTKQGVGTNFVLAVDGVAQKARYLARYTSGGSCSLYSTEQIQTNRWYHLAASRVSGYTTLYVNGVADVGLSDTGYYHTHSILMGIGAQSTGSSQWVNSVYGYVSSVRVVKGTGVYTASFTPPTSPLTAITNTSLLLGGKNGQIVDYSTKSDLITIGDAKITGSIKKYNSGSIYFDGTGDYITIPSSTDLDLGTTYTIEGWVYPTSLSSNSGILLRGSYNTGNWTGLQYSIRWLTTPVLRFYFWGTTNVNEQVIDVNNALTINTWTHIAMVRSGSVGTVYINGTQSGTISGLNAPVISSNNIVFGDWYYYSGGDVHNYFSGSMDDFRFTKGVARYTASFTPPTAPLPLL